MILSMTCVMDVVVWIPSLILTQRCTRAVGKITIGMVQERFFMETVIVLLVFLGTIRSKGKER